MESIEKAKVKFLHGTSDLHMQIAESESLETLNWQKEESPSANYKRYKDLADFLPQSVFETDDKGNITFANRNTFKRTGYTPEDIKRGLNGGQLVIPEDRDKLARYMLRILYGEERDSIEITSLNKDGSTFPSALYASPIVKEGKHVGVRGIVIDISRRKATEEKLTELYEKERRLREKLETEIEKVNRIL